jgi:hypothetical protein
MAKTSARKRALFTAAVLGVAVAGCDGERNTTATSPGAAAVATKTLGPIEAKISVSPRARPGEKAGLSVDLTNRADSVVQLERGIEWPPFNVVVLRPSGDTVWARNPQGLIALVAMAPIPMEPGETRALGVVEWDLRDARGRVVDPGTYLVHAKLWIGGPQMRGPIGPVTLTVTR